MSARSYFTQSLTYFSHSLASAAARGEENELDDEQCEAREECAHHYFHEREAKDPKTAKFQQKKG